MAGKYWVTWKNESDSAAARASAKIWGPQATAPPQLAGYFQAGPFDTKADAVRYEDSIGTGTIIPPPGTPVLGGQHVPNPLSGIDAIGHFFAQLGTREMQVRIGEVVLGGVLITVGVAHLMGVKPAELARKVIR